MFRTILGNAIMAACLGVALLPAAASAQSVLTGVVKDSSGGVLPGVTVEAASPALIEKVRTVATDAQGRAEQQQELRPRAGPERRPQHQTALRH